MEINSFNNAQVGVTSPPSPPPQIDLKLRSIPGGKGRSLSLLGNLQILPLQNIPLPLSANTIHRRFSLSASLLPSLARVRACVRERALACASRVVSLLLLSLPLLLLLLCEFFICLFCHSCSCVLQSFFFLFFGAVFCHNFFFLFEEERRPTARNAKFGSFVSVFFGGAVKIFLFLVCFSLASFPVMG